jgi:CRP/FNR family transcriptional regulator
VIWLAEQIVPTYADQMELSAASKPENFCETCAIRNRAICADLERDEIEQLGQIGRRRHMAAGEQLMWEGDEAVLVANVIEGILKLSTHTAEGKEQILGLAFPADFLGRPFGKTAPFGVEALTDCHICVFDRSDFDRFAREHSRLEHKLLERTLSELDRTRKWMLLLGRMNAEQKIASFLLESSDRLAPAGCKIEFEETLESFKLPLTRQQIADILGLTIETVSRQLTKLKRDGLIDLPTRREVVILNREALELIIA